MKKIITVLLLSLIITSVMAQDKERNFRDPKAQEKIKAARIAFITERLELSPEEAEKFWPIYREFTGKRMALHQEYQQIRKNTGTTSEQQEKMIETGLSLRQKELDLEKEYSQKMLTVISAQRVLNLKDAEDDFRKLVMRQIQQRQMQEQRRQQNQRPNEQRQQPRNN
jgi:hypothetical protein